MKSNGKKLKKDGKKLEKLVKLIQEALKSSPGTIIQPNHKIKNAAGRNREFDIVVMTPVNGFNILIAIECKEYNKPVSVEKVEAFITKCDRFPDINKKIFISQSGYQADARNAAKEYGVELYDISDISNEVVLGWLPIRGIGTQLLLNKFEIYLDVAEEELESSQFAFHDLVHFVTGSKEPVTIEQLVLNALHEKKRDIWNINMLMFLKRKPSDPVKQVTNIPFKISFKGAYLTSPVREEVALLGVEGSFDTWFDEFTPHVIASKAYGLSQGPAKANYVEIDAGDNQSANFVFTADKLKIFHTDETGFTQELQTLATYDPKTDRLTLHNHN